MIFWIFWGIDALIGVGAIIFVLNALAISTNSASNILGVTATPLIVLGGILAGSLALRAANQVVVACVLLSVPTVLGALMFLAMSLTSWH